MNQPVQPPRQLYRVGAYVKFRDPEDDFVSRCPIFTVAEAVYSKFIGQWRYRLVDDPETDNLRLESKLIGARALREGEQQGMHDRILEWIEMAERRQLLVAVEEQERLRRIGSW
ncbi:MAG: hypothetical protein M1828_004785 [Chrysothrix sp. TS-e1954]|nr:MAG: hypothetical protein M1828_004785 [Chrysothrix sp. TS-e1954]